MAVPTWPAGVPNMPILPTHNIEPMRPPLRTEMQQSNVRQRFRPGDNTAIIRQTVAMTPAQYDLLVSWGKDTIGNWTGRFSVPVWLGSSCATKVCQFDDGAPQPSSFSALKISVQMTLRVYDI